MGPAGRLRPAGRHGPARRARLAGPGRPAWPAIGVPAGRPENVEKQCVFIGFLYAGNPPAPPRERQLGPSGRRTQQEPFASRSREKSPPTHPQHVPSEAGSASLGTKPLPTPAACSYRSWISLTRNKSFAHPPTACRWEQQNKTSLHNPASLGTKPPSTPTACS